MTRDSAESETPAPFALAMSIRRVRGSFRSSQRRYGSTEGAKKMRSSSWIFKNDEWRLVYGKCPSLRVRARSSRASGGLQVLSEHVCVRAFVLASVYISV